MVRSTNSNDQCVYMSADYPCDYCQRAKRECGPKLSRTGVVLTDRPTTTAYATNILHSKASDLMGLERPRLEIDTLNTMVIERQSDFMDSPEPYHVSAQQISDNPSEASLPDIENKASLISVGSAGLSSNNLSTPSPETVPAGNAFRVSSHRLTSYPVCSSSPVFSDSTVPKQVLVTTPSRVRPAETVTDADESEPMVNSSSPTQLVSPIVLIGASYPWLPLSTLGALYGAIPMRTPAGS